MAKTKAKARALPTVIPATIPSILGPVPVTRVADLRDINGKACYGIWRSCDRDVRLEANMSVTQAWSTYWHEWAHVALWDCGVMLRTKAAERVCDAMAAARVREMLDG